MISLRHRVQRMALVMGFVLLGSSTALARMSDEEFQQAMQQLQADSPDERLEAVELLGRRGWRRRREISPRLRRLHDGLPARRGGRLRAD